MKFSGWAQAALACAALGLVACDDGGSEGTGGQGGGGAQPDIGLILPDGGNGGAGGGAGGAGGGGALPACSDGRDNDNDGLIDEEDRGCDGP
ncbi:MAG: hypothetical protein KC613_13645, partial [Myxococcales bacterium]|nr:hypothetical protein [Myxococcales bacterium]